MKVIRLGFDQAGRLLEIGAHTLEDEGRVIVFQRCLYVSAAPM